MDVAGSVNLDWSNPDYAAVLSERVLRLNAIRKEPGAAKALKVYYRNHIADFINDWGCTFDPRNIEMGLPPLIPFCLFPKQREMIDWIIERWMSRERGLVEKSRDTGVSWCCIGVACALCLFYDGMAVGFGSRKEEYVDKIGAPRSLFYKARYFMSHLPSEFRGGWNAADHAPSMRIIFPQTKSYMGGEAGDNIGRGDRTGIYFVDEAAHLQNPEAIEASLSQTTNCRIDVSSVNGSANPFAQKRHSGKIPVFIFDWRDDPRKNDAWYDKQVEELDPITLAQEVDRDYSASTEGIIIPAKWVRSSVDAHLKLKIEPAGESYASLDVADEGADLNAMCGARGVLIEYINEWSGQQSDIFATTEKAFAICEQQGYTSLLYDSDGLGASVRGDARVINERRMAAGKRRIDVNAFRGSAEVLHPEKEDVKGRKNKDYFLNRKAQAWFSLRRRFFNTYNWVQEGKPCNADEIISISSQIPPRLLNKLIVELSQPTYSPNTIGKMVVNKKPDGARSPNLADSVMQRFSGSRARPFRINKDVVKRLRSA